MKRICFAIAGILVATASTVAIATIALAGGVKQLTYAGHPLYTYSGAYRAAETTYVGAKQFGGSWYALSASGAAVR